MLIAYTDYPMFHLGDSKGAGSFPIRQVEVVSYDTDKYVVVKDPEGNLIEFKAGYLYSEPGRFSNDRSKWFDVSTVEQDPNPWDHKKYLCL